MDDDDIGVIERSGGPHFPFKAAEPIAVGGEGSRQNLDGYFAAETGIAGAVDFSHLARAEQRDDFIGAEHGTWSKRQDRACRDSL